MFPSVLVGALGAVLSTLCVSGDSLPGLLTEYFRAEASAKRRTIQDRILEIDGLDSARLAAAIRGLRLWGAEEPGDRDVTIKLREEPPIEKHVWIRLPKGYAPDRPWPLIIALHGVGANAVGMMNVTAGYLGDRIDEFILAAPQDLGPLGFTEPDEVVSQPRELLDRLRCMFHIDSDRVYLIGYSLGSHNAWMATVMHADCWAGIVALATPLQVVGDTMTYPEILPNCRNTAILSCWGRKDTLDENGKPHPQGGNAALSRILKRLIEGLKFKHFDAVEQADADHFGVVPPADLLARVLDARREHFPKHVRQGYRLAEQSRAYWIASDHLQGEPLPNGVMRVPIKPGEDVRAANEKYVIGHIGLVEGRCRGLKIDITSRKTGNVILLLSDELLDLDKPITITRTKRERYRGHIKRDLRVMLTEAARGWDFDRLFVARVVIPVGGKVKFGYPAEKKKRQRAPAPRSK